MSTFSDYAEFLGDLLPIIPPDAPLHPASRALLENRGKVPGRMREGLWRGFGGWTGYKASAEDLPEWQSWAAGIGMQGRLHPAIDVDVDVPELADAIHRTVETMLGAAPVRFGRGSRRILPFTCEDQRKRRLAFQAKDPALRTEKLQAVELLGAGQQYVVEGIHPRTGEPYFWQDGRSPATVGAAGLQSVSGEQIADLFDSFPKLLDGWGYEVVSRRAPTPVSGNRKVWQEGLLAPSIDAVERALRALPNDFEDYGEWLTIGMAIRAACGPEHEPEAYALFEDWSLQWEPNTDDVIRTKWDSMRPPFRVGWDYLAALATDEGDGSFYGAHEDFDAVAPTPAPGQESKGPLISSRVQAVFDRWVWVERLRRMCDLKTGDLLDREQFNIRNSHIGDPTSSKNCAWAVLTRNTKRLQAVKSVTYRPGEDVFYTENLPGLQGRCVNQWRDPDANLPASAKDADVGPWLVHVAFVVPNAVERETVLNWLAWIIQNPGLKPNWALVIGSKCEGLGKDLMLEPVRVALGAGNVREITPDDLDSSFTWYLARTRLVLVGEMKVSDRKSTMNRLKPLISAPPYTLSINGKFDPQYEIPNIVAAIFSTNLANALAISAEDRRYWVTWNEGSPRDPEYYERLVAWYRSGGAALAARWLLDRDVSDFKAEGRAPDTAAKSQMSKAALPELEAAIHDAVATRDGPFWRRLVALGEVSAWVRELLGPYRPPGPRRLSEALQAAGALRFDRRAQLGAVPEGCQRPPAFDRKQMTLFAMPGDGAALDLIDDLPALRVVFWADRRQADDDFAQEPFGGGLK